MKTIRMKIMRIGLSALLFLSMTAGAGAFPVSDDVSPTEKGGRDLFTEKDAKLNEIFPPEKQNAGVQKEGISSDGDTKLYAPPPGETGNPQKIVTPLGNADVTVFLLLSFCAAGYYCVKRHNNK